MEMTNELYNSCKGTIYKACRKYFKACPNLEFDELLSQANLIFCNAAKSFDESKGAKFNSWLTTQLQRLGDSIYKERGFNDMKGVRSMNLSLDYQEEGERDDEANSNAFTSCTEYTLKMNEDGDGETWEDRVPEFQRYFDKMSDDAKQIFNDILDGYLYPDAQQASAMGRKAFLAAATDINALKMFKRRYARLGWSVNRVAGARQELMDMIKLWKGDKLPCKLTRNIEKFVAKELF